MTILYLHQHFTTPAGAGGTRSFEMAKRLVAEGHRVVMACGSYAGGNTGLTGPFVRGRRQGSVAGIDVIEFDLAYANSDGFLKRTATFARYALGTLRLALTSRYDLIFATTTPLTAAIPGIAARWLRRKPFVFEVRDLWPELPRAMGVITNPAVLWAMGALEWAAYRSADRLVALAPGIAAGIAKRGVSRSRIQLVPNGCDLDLFGGHVPAWRPEPVGETDLLALYSGTHGIANGLSAVLAGAEALQRRGRSDIWIALAGNGREKPALMERARRQQLSNVLFLDPMEKSRLAGLLAGADVGIQSLANVPAFYDGTSPNKFFDYLAAGKPVLNNYPGWIAGLIQQHNCGYVVPPDDPAAFADALEAAAADRHAVKEKGRAARALAQAAFNRDSLADTFIRWVVDGDARPDSNDLR